MTQRANKARLIGYVIVLLLLILALLWKRALR